jgi:hypothetical protein
MAYALMKVRIPIMRVVNFAAVCRCQWLSREYYPQGAGTEPVPLAIWRPERGCDRRSTTGSALKRPLITARASEPPSGSSFRLLDWSQQKLSDEAGVGIVTVPQLEAGTHQPRRATLQVLGQCLEAAGVEFIDKNSGGSIRFRESERRKR